MRGRPGQSENYAEDQRVGGNVQIKVRHAVHQDCDNASNAAETNSAVVAVIGPPIMPYRLGEYPEDRAENKNAPR